MKVEATWTGRSRRQPPLLDPVHDVKNLSTAEGIDAAIASCKRTQ